MKIMTISSSPSDPLFSIIITLYTLILLYFPTLIFSAVLILTSLLLLSLFRHGVTQHHLSLNHKKQVVSSESSKSELGSVSEPRPDPFYADSFVEWDVRAPLEVIYEGEGEDNDGFLEEKGESQMDKYASLSKFYPETDSDSSSEWELPESPCSSWDAEDKDVLIEIELEENDRFEIEEEDMIEIDLSPANSSAG